MRKYLALLMFLPILVIAAGCGDNNPGAVYLPVETLVASSDSSGQWTITGHIYPAAPDSTFHDVVWQNGAFRLDVPARDDCTNRAKDCDIVSLPIDLRGVTALRFTGVIATASTGGEGITFGSICLSGFTDGPCRYETFTPGPIPSERPFDYEVEIKDINVAVINLYMGTGALDQYACAAGSWVEVRSFRIYTIR